MEFETGVGVGVRERPQSQQLRDGINDLERGEPCHELLHRENLRGKHRLPPVPHGETLQQIALRTPVRQYHCHIIQRKLLVRQYFFYNLLEKS